MNTLLRTLRVTPQTIARVFFIVTALLLLVLSYISYQRIQNLIVYSELVDRSNEVRLELEKVLSQIKDAETGQRGFIITRDSFFLEPFNGAEGRINHSISILDSLNRGDMNIQLGLIELKGLVGKRFNLLEESLQLLEKDDRLAFKEKFLKGKQVMDQIRLHTGKMIISQEKLLESTNRERKEFEAVTPVFIVVLTLFSLILFAASFFIIRTQLDERIRVQAELIRNIDELNRSNSELEQFAYVASHDLQEPLRKIQSFGDKLIIRHQDQLDDDGKYIVDRMRNAAERMQVLINDLLSFSKLVHSDEHHIETINLNKIISNVIADLQVLIEKKHAVIRLSALPQIEGIPSQIYQLFQNLISNALKFSKDGIPPVISIGSEIVKGKDIPADIKFSQLNSHFHKIIVEDNGIGFEEQYIDKIFVIFQRLHGKLEFGGTGIGLAVCKKIVTNHNGFITAKSKPGEGSAFIIYFPAK